MLVTLLEVVTPLICMALLVAVPTALVSAVRGRRAMGGRPLSALAVLSPVVPLVGLLLHSLLLGAVAGLAVGVAALAQIRRRGTRGRALAWTGLTLSALLVVLLLVGLAFATQLQGNLVTGQL